MTALAVAEMVAGNVLLVVLVVRHELRESRKRKTHPGSLIPGQQNRRAAR